jgi:hypothetical protein
VDAALYTYLTGIEALTELVSTRIYTRQAPEATEKPYIIQKQISQLRYPNLTGPSGMVRMRLQLDVFAVTPDSATAVFEVLRDKLDGWRQATLGGEYVLSINLDDAQLDVSGPTDGADPGTHRVRTDWIVLYGETATSV